MTDDGSGRLTATVSGANIAALNFANSYKADVPPSDDIPKTGDDSYVLYYFILMVLSGAGFVGILMVDKKTKRRRP